MITIDNIASALRFAQADTCTKVDDNSVILAPLGFPYDEVCGIPVVVVATQSHIDDCQLQLQANC